MPTSARGELLTDWVNQMKSVLSSDKRHKPIDNVTERLRHQRLHDKAMSDDGINTADDEEENETETKIVHN
jgi:hypothetical protein